MNLFYLLTVVPDIGEILAIVACVGDTMSAVMEPTTKQDLAIAISHQDHRDDLRNFPADKDQVSSGDGIFPAYYFSKFRCCCTSPKYRLTLKMLKNTLRSNASQLCKLRDIFVPRCCGAVHSFSGKI